MVRCNKYRGEVQHCGEVQWCGEVRPWRILLGIILSIIEPMSIVRA